MRFFCFGWGYSVAYLGKLLAADGWHCSGTVRTAEKAETLRQQNIEAYIYDGAKNDNGKSDILKALQEADAVLSSVPPSNGEDTIIRDFGAVLAELPKLKWLGYLSTTGVYGNRNGDWVDEVSALEPTGERGKARLKAEQAWLDLPTPHIFRIAGIYGVGRNALLSVLKGKERRIFKDGQVFSRIHVEDLAAVLKASIDHPKPHSPLGAIYNVCDDEAAPPQDVIEYACELLDKPTPPLLPIEQAELSPMARSFYADNKRVANGKIKSELRIRLQYPNYRVGLRQLWENL